ncbi:Ethanolaminephosphotransferase 1 [Lamellibrachia satsuma]|nr:Ethanolaminephosphotransferase 1 [Lamellibrachia satsuma]
MTNYTIKSTTKRTIKSMTNRMIKSTTKRTIKSMTNRSIKSTTKRSIKSVNEPHDQVNDEAHGQVGDEPCDHVGDETHDQISNDRVGNETRDQVVDEVRDQVGYDAHDQVSDEAHDQVGDEAHDHVGFVILSWLARESVNAVVSGKLLEGVTRKCAQSVFPSSDGVIRGVLAMRMAYKYLSKEILIGFDKYKYNAVDTSPVSIYVSHPLWNRIVQYYPKWWAPNVITLTGFLFIVVNFIHLTYHDNYFYASDNTHPEYTPVPAWVWLVTAIFVFVAHVLDGTDGKQARRTNSCGPLGELFDHGLDSWAVSLLTICVYSIYGRGDFSVGIERLFYLLLLVISMFHITHWEKYNSGVLYLPWSYDISQYGMVIMFVMTYFMGTQVWKFYVPGLTNVISGRLIEFLLYFGVFFLSVPLSLWNVYESICNGTSKKRGLLGGLRPCVPVVMCFGLFIWWVHVSPYEILRQQPRLVFLAASTVFSNTQTRLIVSCMSDTTCEVFNWLLLPLIVLVVGVQTLTLGITELYLLWAYTLFVIAAHIHYGICVVQQLADHMNIQVFQIRQPQKLQ